ncbi:MAG TPA: glycosyltransferase [Dokdonella sp.]|uniref:glycosyltransferase n=1 Tax=Dokdonella sp. TaxID=2291710 RepID=UPI0025BA5C49|nr:glycosyltransferase [Dokdonella sp.]MBX3692466.1 glycosyltransferase [Dokdonella sp.]HNR91225.1 glycosyltransferase [Dokdonella sp.]
MRILHVGKYYAPQRGGIERHLQDLAEWQVSHGADVGAIVHQPPGRWRGLRETLHGVQLWRAGCLAAPLYAPLSPGFPLLLTRVIAAWKPDLLHLHLPNPACLFALASRRARALPWVVHWHADVSPDVPSRALRMAYAAYRPFEQATLRRAAAIIATSQRYLDASNALAGWHAKVRVVPLGVDAIGEVDVSKSPAWPQGEGMRILAVGRLSHYKGFAVLVDALARTPRGRLLLVGDGEEAAALATRVRERGLAGRVGFVRDLDDDALAAAYAAADVFVLPSLDRSEAFGIVLLEAMRAGLAVIASDVRGSGIGHVIGGGAGLPVPPGDVSALAAAITRLDANADLRAGLAAAGRRRWETEFTLERAARAVQDVHLDVLR